MNARSDSVSEIVTVLDSVRRRGVKIWSENGELRYRAPKGALTREDREKLIDLGDRILQFLDRSPVKHGVPPLWARRPGDHIPLTYSQLKYWRSDRLHERATVRTIVSVTRVRGPLDTDVLKKSIAYLVARHEALRTRIVVIDGSPAQYIRESSDFELAVHDLSAVFSGARDAALERIIHERILVPVRVTTDPLFEARLVKFSDREHVLIVLMEHSISDAFSMRIWLRDLYTIYADISQGRSPSLPALPIQFADYAVWQAKAQQAWLNTHGAYWDRRLAGCRRLRFPGDAGVPEAKEAVPVIVPVRLGPALMVALSEWCRAERTTVVMAVFTIFTALVLRWSGAAEAVIRYQTDGRSSPQVENAIGYFAAVLNIPVQLHEGDRLIDLLCRVTQACCEAYEHADASYIDAQSPPPEFTRNPSFNWVPHVPCDETRGEHDSGEAVTWEPMPFSYPLFEGSIIDYEPMIFLQDSGAEIGGNLFFPPGRFLPTTTQAFAETFIHFIKEMLRDSQQRVHDLALLRDKAAG